MNTLDSAHRETQIAARVRNEQDSFPVNKGSASETGPGVTDAWISACFFVGARIEGIVMTARFLKIAFSLTWANWRRKAERNWHYRIWVYDPQTKLRVLLSFLLDVMSDICAWILLLLPTRKIYFQDCTDDFSTVSSLQNEAEQFTPVS